MGKATERCRSAVMAVGHTHPHFLLIHSKIRNNYVERPDGGGMGTMAVSGAGRIFINPDFVDKLSMNELMGVMCHEILHLVLQHHTRSGGRDRMRWNVATDMCINTALSKDQISLPSNALMLPSEYTGDVFAEAVYEWLGKNPQHMPQKKNGDGSGSNDPNGLGTPTAGCSPIDDPDGEDNNVVDTDGNQIDWKQVAMDAIATAKSVGRGTSSVAALLGPRQPKISWKKVIRHGFQTACSRPSREYQTFSRRNRRSPEVGAQFPGWAGYEPKIAMVIDVSGSMDRNWISQIVAECHSLMKSFPGTSVYLVTHTSEVVWEGWVQPGMTGKFAEAVNFSGGTDPEPAYEALRKINTKWDCVIHMTDCEFGAKWPDPPGRQLVVGAFSREISTTPPPGSHVIMCDIDR